MIPRNYEEWKNCIVHDCGINLTKEFAQSRLKVYENRKNRETREFVRLYGESYLNNVIYWLKKV
ncbi:MAG: hypothetical protein AAGI23_00670 [Bacteroidota bacterium]